MNARYARFLPILFAVPLAAVGQSYTAGAIQFSDKGAFTQAQLEQAAGLHRGSIFTQAQLGEAAQRLIDTGYFQDVGAALEGPVKAIQVKFTDKTVPASQMLPVGFRNFVWLTHPEIEAAIAERFPLFIDFLPENSPQQEVIKAALTQALAAKSITAQVACQAFEPTLNHPTRELVCEVAQPVVRVGNIHLSGVSADLAPYVQKSVNATAHKKYIEGPADETSYDSILAPLLDAGYAAATLVHPIAVPSPATAVRGTVAGKTEGLVSLRPARGATPQIRTSGSAAQQLQLDRHPDAVA